MASSITFLLVLVFATCLSKLSVAVQIYRPGPWSLAHATFYGDESASATMGTSDVSMHQIFIFILPFKECIRFSSRSLRIRRVDP